MNALFASLVLVAAAAAPQQAPRPLAPTAPAAGRPTTTVPNATPPSSRAAPTSPALVTPPALVAPVAGPRAFTLAAADSQLVFHVNHKLHAVRGVTKALEGRVLLAADGTARLMVRAPISAFDSGDANRDAHMREVLEVTRFPHVTLKGLAKLAVPTTFPATVATTVDAELEFHGRKHRESVPLKVEFRSATDVRATAGLTLSLDKYGVERPSLLFVRIDDECRIEVEAVVRQDGK